MVPKTREPPNFLVNVIVKLIAPAFHNPLTFNNNIMNYGKISFLKLDNEV